MSKQFIAFFLFASITTSLFAQRVSYPQLVMRSQSPTIFIDHILLPGDDNNTTLAFIFRFNNDFIPYKKVPMNHSMDVPEDGEFFATIRLNTEIFKGKLTRREAPSANSVSRDSWTDTLFTSNFEDTQSNKMYASGTLSTQLAPGNYNYILQLTMMQERNEQISQRRDVLVPDLSSKKTGEIILVKEVRSEGGSPTLQLMNMEDNVLFGNDFFALIRIPNYEESGSYIINVNKANPSRKDTTSGESIYKTDLSVNDVFTNSTVKLANEDVPALTLISGNEYHTYAVVKIPAARFENAPYFLSLTKNGETEPVARQFFRSYWPDMPASLYNLDVSISMLKYIVPDKEIERINSGSTSERERKLREFWESKDPTPNTVYNELMAEYYRRIDYAFKEFGSQENPMGHESDMGEVYIKYGPPNNKERRFPESGKTIEVWEYPSRTFVFEASTGFGDFVLVGTR